MCQSSFYFVTNYVLTTVKLTNMSRHSHVFTLQLHSIAVLWPVLICRPAEGKRLSLPGRLTTRQDASGHVSRTE